MRFFKKGSVSFCGLKLRFGRVNSVQHHPLADPSTPIKLDLAKASSSPPIPSPGSGSPIPTPDHVLRFQLPGRNFDLPPPPASPPASPPLHDSPPPSPTLTHSNEYLRLLSAGYRPRGAPISPPATPPYTVLPCSPSRLPPMNPNFRFPDPVPEYRDPEFVPVTNSSLGSFACDPLDYDSGSSVEFAHYTLPLPVYVRDLGADDMPLGVVGFVFNFPYEIVRTPARVAHIFGADLARHTGQGLIAVNGGDDISSLRKERKN